MPDIPSPSESDALRQRVRRFIDGEVIPLECLDHPEHGLPDEQLAAVRRKARDAGIWAPQLPKEYGGLGLSLLEAAPIFEEAGRSLLGPLALHCAAPDEGNMHLLLRAATPEQRVKYFELLARGECRSCFAMTEPAPGAGSDPTMLRTRAEKQGDDWIINGHKWFISGAAGAAFAIVATVTDPSVPVKNGATLFLVDADNPGWQVVRRIPTMGNGGPGGHCEVLLRDCRVREGQILGGLNCGFALMQARLGPARLTHCMRWLGAAVRALEIATDYLRQRSAFGKLLAEHQGLQWMVAESSIELHASRLMIRDAAEKLDRGEQARQETSMCKVFVAEAVGRVIDRAVQVCGARGVSGDLVLERLYRDVRAFRIYDGPSEVHRMVIARQFLAEGRSSADRAAPSS
ncbi:MAG: acyl-CoA dehydrogenase family protein [Planctomycetes bacterium]|nr:acyl-CoA dehydrogenase family protein [Planctomycetota bacterium]